MTVDVYDFIVFYGTQTGQSKAVAESISERAEQQFNFKTKLSCLSLFEKDFILEEEKFAVFVISSTGDGDSPESTIKFFRKLNRKTLPKNFLANLQFALLGLGDTNYNNFCACPKRLEKRLLDLSAKSFFPSGFCDDAVGTELTAEPWIEGLFVTLNTIFGKTTMEPSCQAVSELCAAVKTIDLSVEDEVVEKFVCSLDSDNVDECHCAWPVPSIKHSSALSEISELKVPIVSQPFLSISFLDDIIPQENSLSVQNGADFPLQHSKLLTATVTSRQKLTKTGAKKSKFEIYVQISGIENLTCLPGDAFYFICPNDKTEVNWLLKRLKLDDSADKKCSLSLLSNTTKKNPTIPDYITSNASLRVIFTTCVDIRRPLSRILLRILMDHCNSDNDKRRMAELSSNQGMKEFSDFGRVNGLSILDVLHAFPSCSPRVERLLEHLPRLQPRPLSIASSTANGRHAFRFVYSLVTIPAGQGRFYERFGLCTGFLTNVPLNSQVMVYMKKPTHFRLSAELCDAPLILIGPGTGVVPFLGFLANLKDSGKAAKNIWLFFGCRDESADFIYRKELESFKHDNILSHLLVCFSQNSLSSDDQRPRYVQHNIICHGDELSELLPDCKIFVCGDANNMANDVFQAFVDILQHQGKSKEQSLEYMKSMQAQFRYVQDVWT